MRTQLFQPFTYEPIRFIGSDGEPLLDFSLEEIGLTVEDLKQMYYYMVLTRRFDDKGLILTRSGKALFYVEAKGQEAAQVASAWAFDKEDWIIPAHREHGVYMVRGYPLEEMFAQLMGRALDPNKGRQMPAHWGKRELKILTISSPVGNQIPQAVGIGMAIKYRKTKEIVGVYFGDGAVSQGDFHVGLNFAVVFNTPVVFMCQNNHWAISVPRYKQTPELPIAHRAKGYGIEGFYVDGNDPLAVYAVTKYAVEKARNGGGPTLIEFLTYRYGAHSTADDPKRYRNEEEVEVWKRVWDPLKRTRLFMERNGWWNEMAEELLWKRVEEELNRAIEIADKSPIPGPETTFEDVFSYMPDFLKEEMEELLEEWKERERLGLVKKH